MYFATPDDAEQAFYTALEVRDLTAMMAIWEPSDEIICIHPLGPRLQGVAQVRHSWRQIFAGGAELRFWINQVNRAKTEDLAVHMVVENITVFGSQEQPAQPVLASNAYRLGNDGWRMILHHGSPGTVLAEPPQPQRPGRLH